MLAVGPERRTEGVNNDRGLVGFVRQSTAVDIRAQAKEWSRSYILLGIVKIYSKAATELNLNEIKKNKIDYEKKYSLGCDLTYQIRKK